MQQTGIHPMQRLKDRLRDILKVIPPGSDVYYLDYPVHSNGGDLLIMQGTEAFFRDYGIRVRARYSAIDFPEGLDIPADAIIALHGGGNFGDLYHAHQALRERVVRTYRRNRVVVLPQTIYFRDEAAYDRAAAIFSGHPDAHLFVRDTGVYEEAVRKFDCSVCLSPDMAHQLWPIQPRGTQRGDLLHFLRTDVEAGEAQAADAGAGTAHKDWKTLFTPLELKAIVLLQKLMASIGGESIRPAWYRYASYLTGKAVREFSAYETIRTSRLHGHILACLLDKPNVLLDNSYGKNSAYYHTWTFAVPSARLQPAADPAVGHAGRTAAQVAPAATAAASGGKAAAATGG